MARVQLGDWGTYYYYGGGNSPSGPCDWQTRWKIQYEQNPNSNTTTIYAQPYLKIKLGEEWTHIEVDITTTINGVTKTQHLARSIALSETSNNWFYYYGSTHTFTINHNSDGTASCNLSGKMFTDWTRTASHSWALPTINVSSSISNNTSTSSRIDFGSQVNFSISRPNNTITHALSYSVNGNVYTIGNSIGDNVSYAFPISLINSYPSNSEVAITVNCLSSNGTSSSTIVYLKVPNEYVPTIFLAISDVGTVPIDWGIYVKSKSKIRGVITANGSANSTIRDYSASANNQTFNAQEFTTTELNSSGDMNINATVTDTRSRTASDSKTINVCDYSVPTFVKIEVVRCDSEGNEDDEGIYGKVVCQYSISPCENKNDKSLIVTYGSIDKVFALSDYSGTLTAEDNQLFENLDITANHTFTFKLIDTFNIDGIQQSYIMPPSYVLVSKRAGGKGISFGQIATKDGFNVYMDAEFYEDLTIPENTMIGNENLKEKIESGNLNVVKTFGLNVSSLEELKEFTNTSPAFTGSCSIHNGPGGNCWYNVQWIPHRTGNGQSDNSHWGQLILWGMTANVGSVWLYSKTGNSWNGPYDLRGPQGLSTINLIRNSISYDGNYTTHQNGANGYKLYIILGKTISSNSGYNTAIVPADLVTSDGFSAIIADESAYVRFTLAKSGNDLLYRDNSRSSTGYVQYVYGIK